ncbi:MULTISPECIES: CAP domain-containing protein [unclassified Corynebacterium]|uniref:CAP domain-containing protein n=1 Tax=unclassified Corynebacterium TaxID=2624378 RepID=UPI0029CA8A12|nr:MULTISPECIES: CAP domain-containing protein [unclassified Corynebacterium]WPF65623.1 CAP domain-containing protein [Corynebacterium sp. 22KM0430]WPF68118.1 CAP domain-containing protein [Corynebacterium sp. 21KM1197]
MTVSPQSSANTATKVAGTAALAATPAALGALSDAPGADAADATILHEETGPAEEVQEETVSTSDPNSDPAGAATAEEITAEEINTLTNEVREEHGLPPLSLDATLNDEAAQWAKTMSTTGIFEHAEGDFSENIHFHGATISAQNVMQDWLDSEGHRANLLDPEATRMGAGVSHDENGTYSVQRFI